jgi:hypothetical protein
MWEFREVGKFLMLARSDNQGEWMVRRIMRVGE